MPSHPEIPDNSRGRGAFFLGDEPGGAYQWLANIGGTQAAIRVICPTADLRTCQAWPDGELAEARAAGLRPLLIVWIGDDGRAPGDCGAPVTPALLEVFGRDLAARYGPIAYAYGWEPDGCTTGAAWRPTAAAFYAGIHSGDAGAEVVLGLAFERFRNRPGVTRSGCKGPFDWWFWSDLPAGVADTVTVAHWWDWRSCWAGLADKRRFVPGAGVGGGGTKAGTVQAQGVGWMLKDCAQNGTRWCLLYRAVDGADESPAYGLIHRDGTLAPGGEAFRAGP